MAKSKNTSSEIAAPGTATIVARNDNAEFDPLNTTSPIGGLSDTDRIVIDIEGVRVFTGLLVDWKFKYPRGVFGVATLKAYDDVPCFLNEQVEVSQARPEESTYARIRAFVAAAGYTGPVSYPATGDRVAEDIYPAGSLGDLVQQVCVLNSYVIAGNRDGGVEIFTTRSKSLGVDLVAGPGGNAKALERDRKRTDYWSAAKATRPGGSLAGVRSSLVSPLPREANLGELPAITDTQLVTAVENWVYNNSQAVLRIAGVTVDLEKQSVADRQAFARSDVGDSATTFLTVPGMSDVHEVESVIQSILIVWSKSNTCRVTFQMSSIGDVRPLSEVSEDNATFTATEDAAVTVVVQEPPGTAGCEIVNDVVVLEWTEGGGTPTTQTITLPHWRRANTRDFYYRGNPSDGVLTMRPFTVDSHVGFRIEDTVGVLSDDLIAEMQAVYGHNAATSTDTPTSAVSVWSNGYEEHWPYLNQMGWANQGTDDGWSGAYQPSIGYLAPDIPGGATATLVLTATIAPPPSTTRLSLARGNASIAGPGIPGGTTIMLESDSLTEAEMEDLAETVAVIRGYAVTFGVLLGSDEVSGTRRVFFEGSVPDELVCENFDLVTPFFS